LALAIIPNGYTAKDIAILMKERLDKKQVKDYTPAKAAYDIRKLRGKGLVVKIEKRRKYKTTKKGMETIISDVKEAGHNKIVWDSNDLPSGTYFIKLSMTAKFGCSS